MGAGDEKVDQPVGVVLMENLTRALLKNTEAQLSLAQAQRELLEEIKTLREDIEELGGVSGDVLGHLTTYLRILDHVAMSSLERPPKWKDVQEILREIKDEIQQAEAEAEREENEESGGEEPASAKGSTELFPKRKTS
jgi:hypothetical protein